MQFFLTINLHKCERYFNFAATKVRGVAQLGLEYASGGRGVGSSNLLTPTLF